MNIDIISASEIADNDHCLKAEVFVDPLATEIYDVERKNRTTRARLRGLEKRLIELRRQREIILETRRGRG